MKNISMIVGLSIFIFLMGVLIKNMYDSVYPNSVKVIGLADTSKLNGDEKTLLGCWDINGEYAVVDCIDTLAKDSNLIHHAIIEKSEVADFPFFKHWDNAIDFNSCENIPRLR